MYRLFNAGAGEVDHLRHEQFFDRPLDQNSGIREKQIAVCEFEDLSSRSSVLPLGPQPSLPSVVLPLPQAIFHFFGSCQRY